MEKLLNQRFAKDRDSLLVVHDRFTFWEFFKVLQEDNYGPEDIISFILTNCSLSAMVFQECIDSKSIFRSNFEEQEKKRRS